jgi:Acetyltransferase (GNAT) domain
MATCNLPALLPFCASRADADPTRGGIASGVSRDALRVSVATPSDEKRWADFVEAHPQGVIYQHPQWVAALEEEYGRKSCTLLCHHDSNSGQLRGVLSLMDTKGLPFNLNRHARPRLAALPRTPFAGPLALDSAAAAALLQAAQLRLLNGRSARQLQVRSLDGDLAPLLPGMTSTAWKEIYLLELPTDAAELSWGSLGRHRHRVKGAVNRALKLGVEVREAETEADLRQWYQLYLETMRWHISPPRPYRFLLSLWNRLRPLGKLRLLLAERHRDGHPVLLAGYLFMTCSQTVHCYINGRRRDSLVLHPNDLLQWKAIQDACEQGYRRYDLGEVEAGQKGLVEFKIKWGATPLHSYRYYWPGTDPVAQPSGMPLPGQSLLGNLWRRVPLGATALLGDWLYRYL